jgi:hypothetical protein
MRSIKKTKDENLAIQRKHRAMLRKLALIHNTSMTGAVELLIQKEAVSYGLIESRN